MKKSIIKSLIIASTFASCQANSINNQPQNPMPPDLAPEMQLKCSLANNNSIFHRGDTICINYKAYDFPADSVRLANNYDNAVYKNDSTIEIGSENMRCGSNEIILYYYANNIKYVGRTWVTIKAKSAPINHKYTIVNTYPHDREAYTQGLEYIGDNQLFESTGLYGKSSLRRVNLTNGKILQSIELDSQYFGEGMTVIDNEIYQFTWRENTGFVYDKSTFERKRQFSYPTEGWGMCFDGEKILISDGSHRIYFMDKTFAEIGKIEVFDDFGPVRYLNELELIDGFLYANIYQTNYIVKINPQNGEVVERINLAGLLKATDYDDQTDVLNGIAYDKAGNRLFVTGKNWSKLFEIKITD